MLKMFKAVFWFALVISFTWGVYGCGSSGDISCQDDCAQDQLRCSQSDNGYEVCGNYDGDSCLEWGGLVRCASDETCSSGECSSTCSDECTQGQRRCSQSENGYQVCGDYDADSCQEWGGLVRCASDETCSSGECSSTCSDECTQGQRRCSQIDNGYEVCGNYDGDSCLDWGGLVRCASDETCSSGECSSTCSNECTQGQRRCSQSENGYEVCGNYDGDSCLEWGGLVRCASDETCSGGDCTSTCSDECTQGQQRCSQSENGYEVCGDYDGDSCLDWGGLVRCASDETCSNGECSSSCSDECTQGQRRCSQSENGYEVCGDYDADSCLDWGGLVRCASDETCSSGDCVSVNLCNPGESQCTDDYGFQACGPDTDDPEIYTWGSRIPCLVGDSCLAGECIRNDCLETETIFLLDRSSSMLDSNTWHWVKQAFIAVLGHWEERNYLGFRHFPDQGCGVSTIVPLAKDNAFTIQQAIDDPNVGAATPIQAALEGLSVFGDPNDGQAVMVISDGSETCGTEQGAIDAAGRLWRSGVRVYAVAVTTTANKAFLDQVAQAGGTAAARQVNTEQELIDALDDIFNDLLACRCLTNDTYCGTDGLLYTCSSDERSYVSSQCNTPENECYQTDGSCLSGACHYPYDNGKSCQNGNPCTLNDVCQNGACQAGDPKCDDGKPCTDDPCDTDTGQCGTPVNVAAGTSCSTDDPCTIDETCDGSGNCIGGSCSASCSWYLDGDNDEYGLTDDWVCQASQPAGYAADPGDCCDTDDYVNPGENWFRGWQHSCGGYDFNCDGVEEKFDDSYAICQWAYRNGSYQCIGIGWGGSIPDCGESGTYHSCNDNKNQSDCLAKANSGSTETQRCR